MSETASKYPSVRELPSELVCVCVCVCVWEHEAEGRTKVDGWSLHLLCLSLFTCKIIHFKLILRNEAGVSTCSSEHVVWWHFLPPLSFGAWAINGVESRAHFQTEAPRAQDPSLALSLPQRWWPRCQPGSRREDNAEWGPSWPAHAVRGRSNLCSFND